MSNEYRICCQISKTSTNTNRLATTKNAYNGTGYKAWVHYFEPVRTIGNKYE